MENKSLPIRSILLLLVLTFIFATITTAQTVNIKVIETSDVHGAIFPYNFTSDRPSNISLAQVETYVSGERGDKDQEVILIDNGDILQGDPSVYYYNFEKTDTLHLLSRVMNFMKYDVATVGNHDIETGHPVYDRFHDELNFPWLAANAIYLKKDEPYFQPYYIIERKGIKIAVLGLITPGIPNWLPKNIWSGMEFEDMIMTAKKWVPVILEKEKPDLLIGLFHAGVDHTYDDQSAETPRNENASQLVAEQVPGFDIIFVGHDHQEWNYKIKTETGDSVMILGPSSRARSLAVADIKFTFNPANDSWDNQISSEIINVSDFKPDKVFMEYFERDLDIIKGYVSQPIGKFTDSISAQNSLFGNSPFVDLIHRIQLKLTNADISFTAPLSIYSKIKKGDVFVRDMFNLYRYENLLYTMQLSGKEILDYLEYSYALWFNTLNNENDHLLHFEKDEDGQLILSKRSNTAMLKNRYYNFDSAEGVKYIVDVSKPVGERVKIISLSNGEPFDLSDSYDVAINSYRGNGGGGHLIRGAGIPKDKLTDRVKESTEKDLRFYMMKWIETEKIVEPVEDLNWEIAPKDLVKKAIQRDYKLMFSE